MCTQLTYCAGCMCDFNMYKHRQEESGRLGRDKMREVSYLIFELERQRTEYIGLYTRVKCMGQCSGGWEC